MAPSSVTKFYVRFSALKKWENILINNQVIKASFYELCCLGASFVANDALFKKKKSWDSAWEQVQRIIWCLWIFEPWSLQHCSCPTPSSQLLDLISAAQLRALFPFLIISKVFLAELEEEEKKKRASSIHFARFCKNGTSRESIFVLSRRDTLAYFQEGRATHN